jgi:hypothetical protein
MKVEINHAHIYKFPGTIPVVVDQIVRGLEHIREANRVTSMMSAAHQEQDKCSSRTYFEHEGSTRKEV